MCESVWKIRSQFNPRNFTAMRAIKTRASGLRRKREVCVLRTRFRRLSCFQHLSVNLVAWNSDRIFVSDVSRTRTTRCPAYRLTLSLLSCLACGLLIGRGDGTSGQAPMCVPIGADMTAAVATRRRAFQYGLMHRQNCREPRDTWRGYIRTFLARSYTQLERRGAHARDGCGEVSLRRAVFMHWV